MLAAEPDIYQPAGAPADPKVPASWNLYRDYAHTTELLKQLAAAHPNLCKLESLGKSHDGREMWLLSITKLDGTDVNEKPAFWVDGSIHANEIQATEVVLYTAWYLLESYGRSPFITRLLDDRVFYCMPIMSPDSRDHHFHRANTVHTPRTGQRPRDDDADSLMEEDHHDDLDGDGHITKMRIADPWGRSKPHADYPELMIDAAEDERGSYTLLGSEDHDNDDDGNTSEDGDGFYDPNRQFPWNWQPNYVDRGDHYPLSVHENRLVADAITARPHIAGAQSFHNTGGMITRGPGLASQEYERPDVGVFDAIQDKGVTLLPGYKELKTGDGLYEVHGSEDDFFYFLHGTICFVNELFSSYNYFHKPTAGSYFGEPTERAEFNRRILFGDGLVPWKPAEHPRLGTIEVGGWKKNWQRQPPSFMLEEECHRNMAFVLFHADQMPLVKVAAPKVRKLADNLYEVTAALSNERLTPTRLAWHVKHQLNPPDQLTISGDQLKVLTGFTAENLLFTEPKEQPRAPESLKFDSIPGMSARYGRWIVQGSGAFTIRAKSVKGGVDQTEGNLR